MTVIEAILTVLRDQKAPLSGAEILAEIRKRNLYSFKTKESLNVVRAQLRRHSEGYDRADASSAKSIRQVTPDAYEALR